MTNEELKELNVLAEEIKTLEKHLKKLQSSDKASSLQFGFPEYPNIRAIPGICNVDYLYKAYIHQVKAKLNIKKQIFEKWKLVK